MGGRSAVKITQYTAGDGIYAVEAAAVKCGPDISVCICGGTHPHIGASALGIPRPSLRDPSKPSASTSVFTVVGHKEDDLAKQAAEHLATSFGCRVSVQAGLHIDQASKRDIELLWANYEAVLRSLEVGLRASRIE